MILVDKNIKALVAEGRLIVAGYREENVNGVSYDLTIEKIVDNKGIELTEYELHPGDTVFVKSKEKLSIPTNLLGRVVEKNSRMRQGLQVDAPHYQPGHTTYVFMRVCNISTNIINLCSDMKIAQIIFEELKEVPDVPYSLQEGASFQNEDKYVGLGNYKVEYEKQTYEKIERTKN